MKAWRIAAVAALVVTCAVATSSAAGAATHPRWGGHHHPSTYTCNGSNGGVIPAGWYGSVVVTGVCYMPAGSITIARNLVVAPGALLDAVTPGDPTGSPAVPATVDVWGNVFVGQGAVLLLGCSPNISCGPPAALGITFDHVGGSLVAWDSLGVVTHDVSFGGSVHIDGGGSPAAATCDAQSAGAPIDTTIAPWSEDPALDFIPPYTDAEDDTIGGNYAVHNMDGCWNGALRNFIGGSAYFGNNTWGDPDSMEIGNNVIWGNLGCWGNSPAPQFGDGADSDLVNGSAWGQCNFDLVLPNPAPEALASEISGGTLPATAVGIQQHFVVSTHQLQTFYGTHTDTPVASVPGYPVTTSSGSSVFAELSSFTLTGNGLTGTADYTGGAPGQAPGEAVLGQAQPNGWQTFLAYDTCAACSFDGQTGAVTLRAYGSTSPGGFSSGWFLITSGGTVLDTPSSPVPPLATLTGFGRFWGQGETLHVVEHLGFG